MTPITRLLAAIALPFALSGPALAGGAYSVHESDSDFATVLDAAKLAIQERGMYINNIMHLGEMLERTGKDLGMDETLFAKAESIEFCSAVLSRRMAAEDPARIVYCPFIVTIYVLPGELDKTYVAYRTIPQEEVDASPVMAEVAEMLQGVAEGAVSW